MRGALLAGLSLLWAASLARAQDKPVAKPADPPVATIPPGDVIYLPGDNNRLVPVPLDASLQEYLDWLDQRSRQKEADVRAAVLSVRLDGALEDDRARLTAIVQVQVTASTGWVPVSLALPEAVLSDASHTGPGDSLADGYDAATGYRWLLAGAGKHELRLELLVPVRKQPPQRRLQLSLPTAPVTALKLKVPQPKVLAKAGERTAVSVKPADNGCIIEALGLGQRFDLQWQAAPEAADGETALEVSTLLQVAVVDAQTLTWDVSQRVQALQGTFAELKVTLPPDIELLRVEGPEYLDHRPVDGQPRQIAVQLRKPTAGPVDLRWTARGPMPRAGEALVLQGFDVDRARIQSGFIAVNGAGDYRVAAAAEGERFVLRANASELPSPLRQTTVSAAYRFLNQPFRLPVMLNLVPAFVAVDPSAVLHVARDQWELDLAAVYQVSRGSISDVQFAWPDCAEQGWTISAVLPGGRPGKPVLEGAGAATVLRLRLDEPQRDSFEIRLLCRRTVRMEESAGPLRLPVCQADTIAPPLLAVSGSDNLLVTVQSTDPLALRPVPLTTPVRAASREPNRNRRAVYRVDAGAVALSVAWEPRGRELTAESSLRLSAVNDDRLALRQRILARVLYEPASQILVKIPASWGRTRPRLTLAGQGDLVPASVRALPDGGVEWTCPLNPPRLGTLELELAGMLPVERRPEDAGPWELSVPVATLPEASGESLRVAWEAPEVGTAQITADEFTLDPLMPGENAWVTPRARDDVRFRIVPAAAAGGGGLRITRAWMRTSVDASALATTRARWRMTRAAGSDSVAVTVPGQWHVVDAWWNRTPLRPGREVTLPDGRRSVSLSLPSAETPTEERLLTVDCAGPAAPLLRPVTALELIAPVLNETAWVPQAYWEIRMPPGEHILDGPKSLNSQQEWQRHGLYWAREPLLSTSDLERWIGAERGPPTESPAVSGPVYLYEQAGAPQLLSVTIVSQPVLVLVGSGLFFGLGLLMVRVRAARHLITVLAAVLLLSVLALWWTEPVLVLAQPAALGLLLAGVAAAAESWMARDRLQDVVTLSSPSGFMTTPSSIREPIAPTIGSDDHTAIRVPSVVAPEMLTGIRESSGSAP